MKFKVVRKRKLQSTGRTRYMNPFKRITRSKYKATSSRIVNTKFVTQTFHVYGEIKGRLQIDQFGSKIIYGASTRMTEIMVNMVNHAQYPQSEEYIDVGIEKITAEFIPLPYPIHGNLQATGMHCGALISVADAQREPSLYQINNLSIRTFAMLRKVNQNLKLKFATKAYFKRQGLPSRILMEDARIGDKIRNYLGVRCPEFAYGMALNVVDQRDDQKNKEYSLGVVKYTVKATFRGRK